MRRTLQTLIGVFILFAGRAPAATPGLGERVLVETAAYRAWLLYPPEKVRKLQPLSTSMRTEKIEISAARNETESFVLVIRPRIRRPLLDLRIVTPDTFREASSNGRTVQLHVSCRRIGYVYVDAPSGSSVLPDVGDRFRSAGAPFGISGEIGFFPDPLFEERFTFADPGQNTQFWVTVRAPRNTPSGTYAANLRIQVRGEKPVDVPLVVRVRRFTLPDRPPLWNVTCWSPQHLQRYWKERDLKEFYRWMAACGQTPDPILPQPKLNIAPDDTVTVDAAEYERMLDFCLNELGMPCAFFPRVGGAWYTNVYFLWHTPDVLKQRWYGVRIFDDQLRLTERFRRVFAAYIRQMLSVFRRLRCEDRILMTTMDEPHTQRDLEAVRRFGQFVKSIAPNIRLFCTAAPCRELAGVIDVWCPQRYDPDGFRRQRTPDDRLLFYKNWLHLIDAPMVDPRLYGWIAWKMRASGWLTYATMGRWARAWEAPYVVYPNTGIVAWGLGLWWYPDLLRPRIVPSIRWEMMREGAEDYAYLRTLDLLLQQVPEAHRSHETVRKAQKFFDSAAARVIRLPGVLPGSKNEEKPAPAFTTSNRLACELRNRIADWIERLTEQEALATP